MIIKMCNSVMLGLLLITLVVNFTSAIPTENRILSRRFLQISSEGTQENAQDSKVNIPTPIRTNTNIKSSLFITAPSGKNALINLKIKNTSTLFSIGLYQKDFVIMSSNEFKILTLKKDKSAEIKGKSLLVNSLNINGGVKYLDKPQWRMVHHDSFHKNQTSLDWNFDKTTQCGFYSILGGDCQTSTNQLVKIYDNLPPHTKVRIEALYHFIGAWDSHTGYMKVELNPDTDNTVQLTDKSNFIWAYRCKNHNSPLSNIKLCGETKVCQLASPINSTVNHSGKRIKLLFGSTLTQNACDQSFGISDVKIYIQ